VLEARTVPPALLIAYSLLQHGRVAWIVMLASTTTQIHQFALAASNLAPLVMAPKPTAPLASQISSSMDLSVSPHALMVHLRNSASAKVSKKNISQFLEHSMFLLF